MGYNELFFDYVDSGSVRSAEVVAHRLMSELNPRSLLDVGCGRGGWANRWKEAGCTSILGVDGDYVDRSRLYVAPDEFKVVDLNRPFDLGQRFDLVQSLEVGEHLRPDSSQGFVDSIVRHGDVVLFSAAVPGQGGTQHINERPIEFWRRLFAAQGYASFDFLRPLIRDDARVEPWYRYNTILYANEAGMERLSPAILRSKVPSAQPVTELASFGWRARRAALRYLPVKVIDGLAVINAKRRVSGMRQ